MYSIELVPTQIDIDGNRLVGLMIINRILHVYLCSGHNDDGQLGLGDTITRLIPKQVGSSTWK